MKKAFTMIELIFVIIIIGILAAIAVPKLAATRTDAIITKVRSDVASIRSAIENLHTKNLMVGIDEYPQYLDDAEKNEKDEQLFDGNASIGQLLNYPIYSGNGEGHWMKTDDREYVVNIMDKNVTFDYNNSNGHFDCNGVNSDDKAKEYCKQLTH